MSITRVGGLQFLPEEAFYSHAPAVAEVAQCLSGKARYLYELAAGESAVAGEEPITPLNPQGLVGVDLSGPPWGSAILRPVAWWGASSSSANVMQPASGSTLLTCGANVPASLYGRFFFRPHAPIVAGTLSPPEGKLLLTFRAYAASGTPTLTVGLGHPRDGAPQTQQTHTLSTTETNYSAGAGSAAYFLADPKGGIQHVWLRFTCSATCYITAACLTVASKRGT